MGDENGRKKDFAYARHTVHLSRRSLLRAGAGGMIAGHLGSVLAGAGDARAAGDGGQEPLVLFFSKTGTTRDVAHQIHQQVGGDIFEIKPKKPYPEDYYETVDLAREELREGARPEIVGDIEDLAPYGPVFVGYPNWWHTLPMACFTFLERHPLAGKTVYPFCTHEGTGLGKGPRDLGRVCPDATIADGLALRGGGVSYVQTERARQQLTEWLRGTGLIG